MMKSSHPAELLLSAAGYADVAHHAGKAAVIFGGVAHRGYDNIGPERRPVQAPAPCVLLEAALREGARQRSRRLAVRGLGIGIKTRKIAPKDLIGRVTGYLFRQCVPGDDAPRPVESEDPKFVCRFVNLLQSQIDRHQRPKSVVAFG
jgi:hypothetical protein